MARIDYYDDTNAPALNSIVVVTAFIRDDAGRILMIRRTDNHLYAIPGGAQDFGESIGQTVVRETREETSIDVEVTGLVGIYTDPKHVIGGADADGNTERAVLIRGGWSERRT